jgi:hypothetical protein
MGTAILKGWPPRAVACCGTDIDDKRLKELAVRAAGSPQGRPGRVRVESDIVVVAVKPAAD